MVGNAHLDIAWLWPFSEGFAAVTATFRSALDRMAEYPNFQFSASSAAYYEWIEQTNPAMFEEIRRRVAEGRWHLVGGWWVEPDCNIPGGESLVRQGLLGQTYFQQRFGRMATVGYNVDSFGHPWSLPQILARSGLTAYVFMRPQPHERNLPARTFAWESADGSRVSAFRVPFEYGTSAADIEEHVERCATELRSHGASLMCFFGVGNHGGGPTRINIETIERLATGSDIDIVFSSPQRFFDEIGQGNGALPVVRDELQHHASGCYSAHSAVKRWNRKAEQLLLVAEKFSTIARGVAGAPAPAGLTDAWKRVLLNQFHDVLAGTSVESVYEQAGAAYGEAAATADRALQQAVHAISQKIAIPQREGDTPIVAFNPHAWPVRCNLELETDGLSGATALVDDAGTMTPLQTIQSEASVGDWRRRVTFTTDLPALGYRLLRTSDAPQPPLSQPEGGATVLENDRWRLTFDPRTGALSSLLDRRRNCEVLAGPGRAVVIDDASDTWGHGVLRFQQEAGSFSTPRFTRLEQGPVRSMLRVETRFQNSSLTQDFLLLAGLDPIEVRVRVDWRERHKMLKLRWPVRVRMPKATFEIPYGTIERAPSGDEEPGQAWIDVTGIHERSGEAYGLSILNDGKYSFDVRGSEMSLTVLRSPAVAHHDPYRPASWDGVAFIDQGTQRFSYAVLPHAGDWRQAGTARRAAELNQRSLVASESFHDGSLPPANSFVEAMPENIAVTALKLAEDGSGDVIVRCYETAGQPATATIRLSFLNQVIEAGFRPHEIKTFRVGDRVREVNLLECST
jgi:alpha-mannosidase